MSVRVVMTRDDGRTAVLFESGHPLLVVITAASPRAHVDRVERYDATAAFV